MSLEMSVVPPVSHESCVSVELPRQPFLLGPAPFVVRDDMAECAVNGFSCFVEQNFTLLPIPHRYSA